MKCDCGSIFQPRYKAHKVCKPGCVAREKELNKMMSKKSRSRKGKGN